MALLIESDGRYELLFQYNGKKTNTFYLSKQNDLRIDVFISRCQVENLDLQQEFAHLLQQIINDTDNDFIEIKHDIDILFKNKETGVIYYLEIKYNDDHDTGKFIDINRKFIKTYAYLTREFCGETIVPILFFFNNKRMKGNIYVPEDTNIRRGQAFFDEFLTVPYDFVDNYMKNLSENEHNIRAFDQLYQKVMSLPS